MERVPASLHKPPFALIWPLLAGAFAGVALRMAFFGKPGDPYAPMMAAFIYFSPVLVGAITVYVAERSERRTWAYYFYASFSANCLYVLGTIVIMYEGLICALVIVPLFALLGGLGGLLMGAVCRATNWPKQTLYCVGILPLILGIAETEVPFPERTGVVEDRLLIDATPDIIWKQILNAPDIRPDEIQRAWMFRIGVPTTASGVMLERAGERVRRVTMGKGIYFDEVVTDWHEQNYVRWTYRFYADSFPPTALDDHVKLGGHYFDIPDTSYTLTPIGRQTELKLQMHYRVSTRFNWYAEPVARFLLSNLESVNLEFYRRRSEHGA